MTKQELQKELKEKVKAGVKPSDLKKLKRSKSVGDIPAPPPLPNEQIRQLEDKIKRLEVDNQQLRTALQEIDRQTQDKYPPASLLQEQLKVKQSEIEELREKLAAQETELKELKNPDYSLALASNLDSSEFSELDQSLVARHQNLKDFFKQYEKTEKLEQELVESIDYAADELVRQDDLISDLRGENRKLKFSNQSLQRDLELAHRAVEWRKRPLRFENDETPWLSPAISLFLVIWFISLLNNSWRKYHFKDNN